MAVPSEHFAAVLRTLKRLAFVAGDTELQETCTAAVAGDSIAQHLCMAYVEESSILSKAVHRTRQTRLLSELEPFTRDEVNLSVAVLSAAADVQGPEAYEILHRVIIKIVRHGYGV